MAFFHDKDLKHLLLDQNCCQVISQSKLRMRVISVHDYTKHPTEYCGEQNIPEESHILPYNCRSDVGHKKGFPNNILLYSLHFNKNICTSYSNWACYFNFYSFDHFYFASFHATFQKSQDRFQPIIAY